MKVNHKNKMSNSRLVFSTDPRDNVICPKCRKKKLDCKCVIEESVVLSQITAVFRIEKNGRGGKTVTVLDSLPKNTEFLKALTKELKAKCGSGGTYEIGPKSGTIEIQGDKRDVMKKTLQEKGIKFKGV